MVQQSVAVLSKCCVRRTAWLTLCWYDAKKSIKNVDFITCVCIFRISVKDSLWSVTLKRKFSLSLQQLVAARKSNPLSGFPLPPPPHVGGGSTLSWGGGVDIAVRGVGRRRGGGGRDLAPSGAKSSISEWRPRKSLVDWFLVKMSSKKQHFYENTLRQANFFSLAPLALAISTPFGGRYAPKQAFASPCDWHGAHFRCFGAATMHFYCDDIACFLRSAGSEARGPLNSTLPFIATVRSGATQVSGQHQRSWSWGNCSHRWSGASQLTSTGPAVRAISPWSRTLMLPRNLCSAGSHRCNERQCNGLPEDACQRLRVCACACMCVHTRTRTHTHTHTCINTHTHTHAHTHANTHAHKHAHTLTHTHTRTHICLHTHMHTHTHAHSWNEAQLWTGGLNRNCHQQPPLFAFGIFSSWKAKAKRWLCYIPCWIRLKIFRISEKDSLWSVTLKRKFSLSLQQLVAARKGIAHRVQSARPSSFFSFSFTLHQMYALQCTTVGCRAENAQNRPKCDTAAPPIFVYRRLLSTSCPIRAAHPNPENNKKNAYFRGRKRALCCAVYAHS